MRSAAVFLILALTACTGPETVTEVVTPGYIARECLGPSPQIVAVWRADLMKTGASAIPMPKPTCVDVEVPEETRERPATWQERVGWVAPPAASYLKPGCGLAATDQQTGVEFCARDNDRDRERDQERDREQSQEGEREPQSQDRPTQGTPTPAPTPAPTPGMMGPGAD